MLIEAIRIVEYLHLLHHLGLLRIHIARMHEVRISMMHLLLVHALRHSSLQRVHLKALPGSWHSLLHNLRRHTKLFLR